ncbi:MAG: divalent metal cation transporter [Patescibacteria group bacterium]|jgi:NRAMP (natural resistance-associated macrophage protein)-like metal ion transporter
MTVVTKGVSAEAVSTKGKLFTISEFRHELGIPLVLARKLLVWGLVEGYLAVDGTIRITEEELAKAREILKNPWRKLALFVKSLGPGLVTGASDDDPGGIGTYSSVGAAYGFSLLWMAVYLLPLMLAVQESCARIGIVTNRGLAGVLQRHYRRNVVAMAVILLIVANVVNIGADLGAMAASLKLILNVDYALAAVIFTIIIAAIVIAVPYHIYAKLLKWLTLSVFAYVITGIIIHPDWITILREAFIPRVTFEKEYLFAMIAVFGTTITPYLFFWQTSEEVEEGKIEVKESKKLSLHHRIGRMRTDVRTGMALANLVFFFIILSTASVLNANGVTSINSAEQAAEALRPFAGDYAFLLFAFGIIGTGLLAVPILAGSGAYALSEVMKWREGLEYKFSQAKGFYLIIAFSLVVGLSLNFVGINPITALYYSAFLNGIIALPLLVAIMIVGDDERIMGRETHPGWVKLFGWLAVAFMAVAVVLALWLNFVK